MRANGKNCIPGTVRKKHKSLCSAITPLKCLFEPGNEGVPDAVQRRFFLHFNKDEVELM